MRDSDSATDADMSPEDYEAIRSAVMETARGRWFLSEFARRNRAADTEMLLGVLSRIENRIETQESGLDLGRLQVDLLDMSSAIARTKAEIAAMAVDGEGHGPLTDTAMELHAIVSTTEKATSEILAAAEKVQEIAWTLREAGGDAAICDELEAQATELYTGCSFQDLTGQRIQKVVTTLEYLEKRIDAMVEIWGAEGALPSARSSADARPDAHLLNGPAREGEGIDQADVDSLFAGGEDDSAQDMADRLFAEDDAAVPATVGDDAETEVSDPAASAGEEADDVSDDIAEALADELLEAAGMAEAADAGMAEGEDEGDAAWQEAETGALVTTATRAALPDTDLSALTASQKQALFS